MTGSFGAGVLRPSERRSFGATPLTKRLASVVTLVKGLDAKQRMLHMMVIPMIMWAGASLRSLRRSWGS